MWISVSLSALCMLVIHDIIFVCDTFQILMSVLLMRTTVMTHLPPALMLLEAVGALSVPVSLATLGMESLAAVSLA